MWAFCGGMQRSGSTLQYQLVAEIAERKGIGRRIGFVKPEQFTALHKEYFNESELLVVKSHTFLPEAIELSKSGKSLVFCVHRDLRDVAVSLFNKNGTPIEDILEKGVLHLCVSNYQSWTNLPGSVVMRYEHMIANMSASVAQIAEHLGVFLDEDECEGIAMEFSHEKQHERIQELRQSLVATGQTSGYDSNSLLHQNHINSGESGQWKQTLTSDQIREIEKNFGSWLEGHEYETGFIDRKEYNGTLPLRWVKQMCRCLVSSIRKS